MKTAALKLLATSLLLGAVSAQAQFSINPLTSFGGGDGWLAPGEGGYAYLTAATTERGMAFGNGHLYLASRANVGGSAINVRILDALTGTDLGALNMGSGIVTGGTFPISMVSVGGDGAIYVANLASPVSATAPFKVYRWANESATPTLAYSSTTVTLGRLGDTFDAIGSGTSTRLVAGESNSSGSGTRNGYVVLGTSDGLNFTDSLVTFASTPPNAGDFRLGVTFTDSSHVIGTAGTTLSTPFQKYTNVSL